MTGTEKRNIAMNTLAEALWGFQGNMVMAATVLTVLLRSYGAGERMIGAISAVEMAGMALPQIAGAMIFRSRRHLKRDLILWHLLGITPFYMLMCVATFFADSLPPRLYCTLMLLMFAGAMTCLGIIIAPWFDWVAHMFNTRIRGRAMGLAFCCGAMAGIGGGATAAFMVRTVHSPFSYGCLYTIATLFTILSMIAIAFTHDPATREPDIRTPRITLRDLLAQTRASLAQRDFAIYLVGRIAALCGFSVLPFVAIHFATPDRGALSGSTILLCGVGFQVGSAIGQLIYGWLGDRHGHLTGVLLGIAMQIVSLTLLILGHNSIGCALAYFTAGMAVSSWMPHTNVVIESVPAGHSRMAHISSSNLIVGLFAASAPLAAGVLAEQLGTTILFCASLCLSFLALAWLLLLGRDPRRKQLAKPI